MLLKQSIVIVPGGVVATVIMAALLSVAGFAASHDDSVLDRQIAGPSTAETGAWRTKTQSMFDPVERTLIRRMYTVWDPMPARDLDFAWIPVSVHDDKEGKINGVGRLVWRLKGKPAYERASIFAEYRGAMQDGRAEGQGSYVDATGIAYQGEWKNGLMEGFGTLTLPGGDEYVGDMRAGKANGAGRYVDITGEIFEGHFVDGQRDGTGTTTLPNANTYRSTWMLGTETEDSRAVRIAQANRQLAQGDTADVRIGISIDKTKARDGDLVYAASSAGSRLMIQPDNKRLMSMWKGNGEIELLDDEETGQEYGVFSMSRGQILPLILVFEVQNRSAAPISVAGTYLAVDSSVTDLEPAIQLSRGLSICTIHSAEYQPTFTAENFGWGAATHAAMHFAFANPNVNGVPQTLNVTKGLGDIVQTLEINLEPELRAAGVNIGTLKARSDEGFRCKSASPATCLAQIRATGVFGTIASQVGLRETGIFVGAAGTLDYTWKDSKGVEQRRSSPYNIALPLGHIHLEAECEGGGEREVIAQNPLQFRLDQSGYRLPISFQRTVPPGQTSRFTVPVKAAKSSQHDFNVVLQLADGREISSRPIDLIYYVPSWFHPPPPNN
jgi:hypothetical protein